MYLQQVSCRSGSSASSGTRLTRRSASSAASSEHRRSAQIANVRQARYTEIFESNRPGTGGESAESVLRAEEEVKEAARELDRSETATRKLRAAVGSGFEIVTLSDCDIGDTQLKAHDNTSIFAI